MDEHLPMKLLRDYSLEIPPFLQRNEDGTYTHPNTAIPLVTATVTGPTPEENLKLDKWGWPVNPADEKARKLLLADQERVQAIKKTESSKVSRAKQAELDEIKRKATLASKANFLQHFKWDHQKNDD